MQQQKLTAFFFRHVVESVAADFVVSTKISLNELNKLSFYSCFFFFLYSLTLYEENMIQIWSSIRN